MKKGIKAATVALAVVTMGSGMAFAQDTKEAVATGEALTAPLAEDETESLSAYISQKGNVSMAEKNEDGSCRITIDNENGGLSFAVTSSTVILNRETGEYITAENITEGMELTVVYGKNSPMGMSLPPYLGSVAAVVANSDKGNVSIGYFGDELVNAEDRLMLNVNENTNIQSTSGAKIRLDGEAVKGKDAIVFYGATTKSIPAQTSPELILILEAEAEAAEAAEDEPEMVALRSAAEGMGYSVTWQGKNKPVIVEKDDRSLEITIDSAVYTVNDEEKTAEAAAVLLDGILYVSDEVFE